jgi:hypothetical protein
LTTCDILLSFPDTRDGRHVESLIRASAMWGFGDLVRKLGADPEQMQRRFGISPGAEHEDDALISLQALARMTEACVAELDCPDFGLRLSSFQGLHILGPIAVIARNAETVQAGLGAIARYLYVHSPALKLAAEPGNQGSNVRFTYEITTLELPEATQIYEVSMGNAVRIVRLLSGTGSGPRVVSFMHDPQRPEASYAAELGCDVRFGQPWCGFEIPRQIAARPIDRADPETRRIASTYLESTYLPSNATLTERVADLARRLLPTGHCSVDEIAEQLAVHPRTLQRHDALRAPGDGDGERRDAVLRRRQAHPHPGHRQGCRVPGAGRPPLPGRRDPRRRRHDRRRAPSRPPDGLPAAELPLAGLGECGRLPEGHRPPSEDRRGRRKFGPQRHELTTKRFGPQRHVRLRATEARTVRATEATLLPNSVSSGELVVEAFESGVCPVKGVTGVGVARVGWR